MTLEVLKTLEVLIVIFLYFFKINNNQRFDFKINIITLEVLKTLEVFYSNNS